MLIMLLYDKYNQLIEKKNMRNETNTNNIKDGCDTNTIYSQTIMMIDFNNYNEVLSTINHNSQNSQLIMNITPG